jgi:hypothetical protein
MNEVNSVLPDEVIVNKIYQIRGKKLMIDRDLAELYGVETKFLKRAVKRNLKRFPEDFMFELNQFEFENLRSQIGTSSWGGTRYLPMVFTEQGVAMLSSVLNSDRAIAVNIQIIRVFSKMREMLETHKEILQKMEQLQRKDIEQDEKIMLIFEYLKQFEQLKQKELDQLKRNKIGFKK